MIRGGGSIIDISSDTALPVDAGFLVMSPSTNARLAQRKF